MRAHNHFEKNALISSKAVLCFRAALCRSRIVSFLVSCRGLFFSKAGLRETMVGYYTSHGRDPFGAIPLTFVATFQAIRDTSPAAAINSATINIYIYIYVYMYMYIDI